MDVKDEISLIRRTKAAHAWTSPVQSHEATAHVEQTSGVAHVILKHRGRVIGIYRLRPDNRLVRLRRR